MIDSAGVAIPEYFNFTSDIVGYWARARPDACAFWWVDGQGRREVRLTFRELAAKAEQAANLFQARGVCRGDAVLITLPRVPQWWWAMLGLIRLGAVPIPCAQQLSAKELAYRAVSADAKAIITDAEGTVKMDALPGIRFCVGEGPTGWIDFDNGLDRAASEYKGGRTRSDDPGILYFTSATTGQPKMVLHTQASYGLGHRLTGELWLDLKPDDVHWNLSDTGWGKAAWSSLYGPWHMGACVFVMDTRGRFNPAAALETLAEYPITTWCAPPTALRMMVRENLAGRRFPHLRHCVTAGEPLNPEVFALWKSATGLTLWEAYGQTETVVLIGNFVSRGQAVRPGSMGQPTPGFEVALLDEQLRAAPAGQEGEIALRVAPERPLGLFQGYWRNPVENAAQFRGDWYLTGDRAWCDDEGYYWFVGRQDDVIKSAGYRIGPFEVESALMEHAAVLEVAVVGKPESVRGQIVKAFVVLRKGWAPDDDLKGALQQHCKQATAPYKYPREIEFVDELPKTVNGKIRRVDLRRRA